MRSSLSFDLLKGNGWVYWLGSGNLVLVCCSLTQDQDKATENYFFFYRTERLKGRKHRVDKGKRKQLNRKSERKERGEKIKMKNVLFEEWNEIEKGLTRQEDKE